MGVITSIREIGFGLRGGELTDKYEQEYSRHFRLYTANATDYIGEDDILAAAALGLPQRWDNHPSDALALCKGIRWRETEYPQQWIAEFSYSSNVTDRSRQSQEPTTEPPAVSWSTEAYREVIDEDAQGTALLNTAGDLIEGEEVERHRLVAVYEDNVEAFDEVDALNYIGCANSTTFRGQLPETWLIRDFITTGRGFKNTAPYWRRRITFVYDPKATKAKDGTTVAIGWARRVLSAGYRQLVSGVMAPILDQGRPVSQAVPLDANGLRLAPGGTPVYLTFHPYPLVDFNAIPGLNLDW